MRPKLKEIRKEIDKIVNRPPSEQDLKELAKSIKNAQQKVKVKR